MYKKVQLIGFGLSSSIEIEAEIDYRDIWAETSKEMLSQQRNSEILYF